MCMHLLKSLGMEVATEHKMTCLVELHRGEMNEADMKADRNIFSAESCKFEMQIKCEVQIKGEMGKRTRVNFERVVGCLAVVIFSICINALRLIHMYSLP